MRYARSGHRNSSIFRNAIALLFAASTLGTASAAPAQTPLGAVDYWQY